MIRYAFLVVFSFGAGVLVSDMAFDRVERPVCRQAMVIAEQATEQAEFFGKALAHVLNGGGLETGDVRVSCRVRPLPKES